MKTLAQQIREAREKAGLTQAEAAAKAGYSRSMWIKFEMGQRVPPLRAIFGIFNAMKK